MKTIIPYVCFVTFWFLVYFVGFLKAGIIVGIGVALLIFYWNQKS